MLVSIQNLSKEFTPGRPTALNEINAEISKGKIVGLVGPDGAGKTTLIRLLAALLLPTKGKITIDGHDTVQNPEEIHSIVGYMPQRFGLYEELTVMQNMQLYADLRGVAKKDLKTTFEKLLSFTSLAPFTDRLAGALSGGMKQKLGLACALIKTPTLLLLDEPSVGIDPLSRRELWKMVHDLVQEGLSVVWSTAYLDEAQRCDSVLLLNDGKLLYNGTPHDLMKRVEGRVFKIVNPEGSHRKLLRDLLNQKNVIDGCLQGDDLRLVLGQGPVEFQDQEPIAKLPAPEKSMILSQFVEVAKRLELCRPVHTQESRTGRQSDKMTQKSDFAGAESFAIGSQHLEKIEPRFEDAFIDLLGGGPGGESKLANITEKIEGRCDTPVVAENLTKKFGSFTAANSISFAVKKGEIFGLLGPNGAGKSTTFKMLCGLLRPTTGKAFVNELNVQEAPDTARSHIGYMAQKFSLYGLLSVRQNLQFYSGIYNLTGKKQSDAIDKMIEIFSLKDYVNVSSESLPLGFKQRLSLACAMMHHPEVLFLDEPTSGVDPITRREFWNLINGLVEKGVTVLVTTHFMDEAEYCDRIALIYRGKIIHLQTPDELKENAKTPENQTPTLEDAFIKLIEDYDVQNK